MIHKKQVLRGTSGGGQRRLKGDYERGKTRSLKILMQRLFISQLKVISFFTAYFHYQLLSNST